MKKMISWILVAVLVSGICPAVYANELKLPRNLGVISPESFSGTTSLDTVIVPYGTTRIESKAFMNSSIRAIYIPETVTYIAKNAFEGAGDVVIYTSAETYAAEYAEKYDIPCRDSGNYYHLDQYFAQQALDDEEFEIGEELLLTLDEYNENYISSEISTDADIIRIIEEVNTLEEESAELYTSYWYNIESFFDGFYDLSYEIEYDEVTESEDGVSFDCDLFSYTVQGTGLERLSADYEIVSHTVSEDGEVFTTVRSNGVLYNIAGGSNGVTIYEGNIGSRSGNIMASAQIRPKSLGLDFNAIVSGVSSKISSLQSKFSSLVGAVMNCEKDLERFVSTKRAKYQTIENLLNNPGSISKEGLQILRKESLAAEAQYRTARNRLNNIKFLKLQINKFDIIGLIRSLESAIDDFKELTEIENHGHPLSNERGNSSKMALISEMNENIRTARAGYSVSIANDVMDLINDVSILLGVISASTGVGAPVAVVERVGVQLVLNGLKKLLQSNLRSIFVGTISNIVADRAKRRVEEIDYQLHSEVGGIVTDEDTGLPLRNVKVSCGSNFVFTNTKGFFSLTLPIGSNTLRFYKKGYKTVEKTVAITNNMSISCNVKMSTAGNITGTVRDAKTGQPLYGVTVRWGGYQTSTDSSGKYNFELKPGTNTLSFSKSGYVFWSTSATCEGGMTKVYDAVLSEELPENTYRIVLTWGSTPSDLDSHLLFSGYHVYYSNKSAPDAELDVDDTTSYGPETVTFVASPGVTYTYFVQDYTNGGNSGGNSSSRELAGSGAVVRVYRENRVIGTYSVPTASLGTRWYLLQITDDTVRVNSYISP